MRLGSRSSPAARWCSSEGGSTPVRCLVAWHADPTDRRTTLAVLTEAGRALVRACSEDAAAEGFGLSGVDDSTLTALTDSLQAVRRARGDIAGRADARLPRSVAPIPSVGARAGARNGL